MTTVSYYLVRLKLNEFRYNHHPPKVKIVPKYIRRGISEIVLRKVRETSQFRIYNKKSNLKEKKWKNLLNGF